MKWNFIVSKGEKVQAHLPNGDFDLEFFFCTYETENESAGTRHRVIRIKAMEKVNKLRSAPACPPLSLPFIHSFIMVQRASELVMPVKARLISVLDGVLD